jgi:hypothetical protein
LTTQPSKPLCCHRRQGRNRDRRSKSKSRAAEIVVRELISYFELALRPTATVEEQAEWCEFLAACSLVELCRAILNLNEFADID